MFLADSQSASTALGIVIWLVITAVYWSPTIFGALSHKHNLGVIATWNFFGFFLFFPWIVAWVKVAEKPQQPTVVFAPPPWGFQPPPYPGERLTMVKPPPNPEYTGPTQPQAGPDKPQGYQ